MYGEKEHIKSFNKHLAAYYMLSIALGSYPGSWRVHGLMEERNKWQIIKSQLKVFAVEWVLNAREMQRKEELIVPEAIRKGLIGEVIFELEEWMGIFQDKKKE